MNPGNSIPELILRSLYRAWSALAVLTLSMLYLTLVGCATWQTPVEFHDSSLYARAVTAELRGVKLSAALLSSDDSLRMFGVNVNDTGVQPIWIEVENTTSQMLWFLRSGSDPDLFSPLEVAWSFHSFFAGKTNTLLDDHFNALSFQNPIAPGTTQSGVIFTNPHHDARLLSIDILGQGQLFPFTLYLGALDDQTNDHAFTLANMKQLIEAAVEDYHDVHKFRVRLEQLPCCATDADGNEAGDPLNVILVGDFADIATALIRRGFRINVLDFDIAQRLFGRPPDIVGRKVARGGKPTNWLRIWVAPFRYKGKTVFIAQAGRPLGWRLAVVAENEGLVLNPNVDEVRNLFIQDMMYSLGLEKLAFVNGVGPTSSGELRDSLGGTSYHTDGLRAVLFLAARPLSLSDVQILDWHPALKLREAETLKEIENDEN